MKIAILTMFNGLSTTYSLVNVVADQLQMLLDAGHEVKVMVTELCPDEERFGVFLDDRLEWVKITNHCDGNLIHWHDYSYPMGKVHPTFYQEVDVIAADFVSQLQDVDVCILHDILYQGWHLVHNVAIRKAQSQLPRVKFLAFTHSLPVPHPAKMDPPFDARYTPMPNTRFVYPTRSGITALAEQYQVPEGRCAVVYNSLPLIETMDPSVQQLGQSIDFSTCDYLLIYPGRLTTGKKFEKVAALAGSIKRKSEKKVHVIFCDFPSADIDAALYKTSIYTQGGLTGLDKDDITFTSDYGFPDGFPRKGVLDLFTLSNLYVCPSFSESFGLTVLEAGSRGNFLVLNEAVPALKELGTSLNAYFMRWDARNFGFDTQEQYHPTEQAYYEEHAENILKAMREDRSLQIKTKIRTHYHLSWIWHHQLEPLLD